MLDSEFVNIEVRYLTTRFASGLVFLAKPSPMFPRAVPSDIELPPTSSANDPHQPNETTPVGEYWIWMPLEELLGSPRPKMPMIVPDTGA